MLATEVALLDDEAVDLALDSIAERAEFVGDAAQEDSGPRFHRESDDRGGAPQVRQAISSRRWHASASSACPIIACACPSSAPGQMATTPPQDQLSHQAPRTPDPKPARSGTRCRYIKWAELMRLTFGLEVDRCPNCRGDSPRKTAVGGLAT